MCARQVPSSPANVGTVEAARVWVKVQTQLRAASRAMVRFRRHCFRRHCFHLALIRSIPIRTRFMNPRSSHPHAAHNVRPTTATSTRTRRFPFAFFLVFLALLVSTSGCQSREEAVRLACDAPSVVNTTLSPQKRGKALARVIEANISNDEVLALLGSDEPVSVKARKLEVMAVAENVQKCELAALWRKAGATETSDGADASSATRLPPTQRTRVVGKRSIASVDEAMNSRAPSFRACYRLGLQRYPELSGIAVLRIQVSADGTVTDAQDNGSSLSDDEVVQCLAREARKAVFSKKEGGGATVYYPIELQLDRTASPAASASASASTPATAATSATAETPSSTQPAAHAESASTTPSQ